MASGDAAGIVWSLDWGLEVYSCTNSAPVTGNTDAAGIVVSRGLVKAQKCINNGVVTSSSGSAAGIVNAGCSAGSGQILDCDNSGAITGSKNAVGIAYYDSDVKVVKNCGNTGEIKATAGDAAGIVITNTLREVSGCYNTANISANDSDADIAIGAAGIAYVKISRLCDNMSKKQNDNSHPCYVVCNCDDATITNNVNGGTINYGVDDSNNRTLTCDTNGILTGYALLTDSDIPTITTTSTTANVVRIGGIIAIAHESFEIKGCINKSNIDFAAGSDSSSYVYAGGIVANIVCGDVNISDCKSLGTIQPIDGSTNLNVHLGGVVGHIEDKLAVKNIYEVDATTGEYIYDDATGEQKLVESYTIIPELQKSISITNTTFGGTIEIATDNIVKDVYAGGLIGSALPHFVNFSVTYCNPTVTIDTNSSVKNHSGGLIGYSEVSNGKVSGGCIKESMFESTDSGVTDTSGNIITGLSGLVTNYATETVIDDLKPEATITSCSPTGNITATGEDNTYAGGLAGYLKVSDSTNLYSISNCSSTISVSAKSTDEFVCVGGLIGYALKLDVTDCSILATDTCPISVTGKSNDHNAYIGGLMGSIDTSEITSSYVTKVGISSTGGNKNYLGGISGLSNDSSFDDCDTTSVEITANNIGGGVFAGGVIGHHTTENTDDYILQNSTTDGVSIDVTSTSTEDVVEVGGLIGYASKAKIVNCSAINGSLSGTSKLYTRVAGLVGVLYSNSIITGCWCSMNSISSTADNSSIIDFADAGGLVGLSNQSSIINCFVDDTVAPAPTIKASADTVCVGGLVGCANASTITNDTNIAGSKTYAKNVAITIEGTCKNGAYMGGLVGKANVLDNTICTISNCYTDGISYTMNADDTINNFYFGGLVGYAIANISSCEANNVNATFANIDATTHVGGLVGYIKTQSNTTIKDSSASGRLVISVSSGYCADVSGLIGRASATSPYTLNITGCNSTTSIDSTCVDQNHIVGGLIGYISSYSSDSDEYYANVTGCYYSGDIDASNTSTSSSSSIVICGGLVAWSEYFKIDQCFVTDISIISESSYDVYVGGLLGYTTYSNINNCYVNNADGNTIKNISVTNSENGASIGGLVGWVKNDTDMYYTYAALNLYCQGNMLRVGGCVGDVDSLNIYNSYTSVSAEISGNVVRYGRLRGRGKPDNMEFCYVDSSTSWSSSATENQSINNDGESQTLDYIWDYFKTDISNAWDYEIWKFPEGKHPIFGEGTDPLSTYIKIYNVDDLKAIASGTSATDIKRYILMNNINIGSSSTNKAEWTPIQSREFILLEGNGKIISYWKISSRTGSSMGLFSSLNNSVIRNVGIKYFSINCTYESTNNITTNIGGLVGTLLGSSKLINCYTDGTITYTAILQKEDPSGYGYKYNVNAGGLIGKLSVDSSDIEIANCYSDTAITLTGRGIDSDNDIKECVGGLIGNMNVIGTSNVTITRCYNSGTLKASRATTASGGMESDDITTATAGGLVGYLYSKTSKSISISNSFSTNSITALGRISADAGGIVGYASSEGAGYIGIRNCYVTSNITAKVVRNNTHVYAAGIVGYHKCNTGTRLVNISYCYVVGNISVDVTGLSINTSRDNYIIAADLLCNMPMYLSLTQCYRYKDQEIACAWSDEWGSMNKKGRAETKENIWAYLKTEDKLNWDASVWDFYDNAHPTLKWQNAA